MRHHEPTSALQHHLAGQSRITALESALSEAGQDIRSITAMAQTAAMQTRSSIQAALSHLADGRQDEAVDILRAACADLEAGIASMGAVH
jgi:glutamine synthetase adenylyltransferase